LVGVIIAICLTPLAFYLIFNSNTVTLVIIYTGDLKGYFRGRAVTSRPDEQLGGLDVLASLVKKYRRKYGEDKVILLDTGDSLFGSFETSYLMRQAEYKVNPVLRLMEKIGYDAVCIGNMDFESGIGTLKNTIRSLERDSDKVPKLVSSNLRDRESARLTFSGSHVIRTREGFGIKIIGSLTEMSREMVPERHLAKVDIYNEEVSIWNEISTPVTRGQINIIVTHSEKTEEIARKLARRIREGIFVIIAGNLIAPLVPEERITENVIILPAVYSGPSADDSGSWVGIFKMVVSPQDIEFVEKPTFEITQLSKRKWGQDPQMSDIIASYREISDTFGRRKIAASLSRPVEAYPLVGPSPMGNLVTDAMRYFTNPPSDFALLNCLAIRAGLPQGSPSMEEIWNALPFEDRILAVDLTGAQILILVSQNKYLMFNFLHISGGKLEVYYDDDSNRVTERIILPSGEEAKTNEVYRVVLSDFIFHGGDRINIDGVPVADVISRSQNKIVSAGPILRDTLVSFLEGTADYRPDDRFRFIRILDEGSFDQLLLLHKIAVDAFDKDEIVKGFRYLFHAMELFPNDMYTRNLYHEQLVIQSGRFLAGENQEECEEFLSLLREQKNIPEDLLGKEWQLVQYASFLEEIAEYKMQYVDRKNVRISPYEFDVVMLWGKVLFNEKRFQDADKVISWCVKNGRHLDSFRYGETLVYAGSLAYEQLDLEEAEDFLRQSQHYDDSTDLMRLAYWGKILQERGQFTDAVNLYDKVLEIDRTDPYKIEVINDELKAIMKSQTE